MKTASRPPQGSAREAVDDRACELRARHLGSAIHEAGEVVGDDLVADGGFDRTDDVVGGVLPAEVLEHHDARQQHRGRVDLVLAGVLRGGAMGGLEDAVTRDVVDVGARCDADAAHLGSQGIGQVVAVEVHRRDHVELGGPGEHLLKGDVGDGVLHEDLVARIATAVVPADGHIGELLTNEVVAPLLEGTLGELHDVALVHPVNPLAVAAHGVLEGSPLQTLRPGLGDGLDADTGISRISQP